MLLAPLCVAGRRSLVEFGVLVTEHEPDVVGVAVLLTDQKMLLAILDRETAFRLDIESSRRLRFQGKRKSPVCISMLVPARRM